MYNIFADIYLISIVFNYLNWNFQDSNFSTYQRMWSFMESAKPSVFTESNVEGVERVVKEKGNYAFLMESTSIEYVIERNCELTQVGTLLDSKGYGIAMPPSKRLIEFSRLCNGGRMDSTEP